MVERRSPKPEVGGSSPSAPAKNELYKMINPLKFIESVKQEAFKVTWPSKKETLTGSVMVVVLATLAALFFLLLDQILKFLLDMLLTLSF